MDRDRGPVEENEEEVERVLCQKNVISHLKKPD